MKPFLHAKCSVRRWGGEPEEYLPIHDFIDSTKACHASMKHRAILHSAFGCFVVEKVFGHNMTLSTGKLVSTRDIAEGHILEDLGFIPSLDDYLSEMPMYPWLGGKVKESRKIEISNSSVSIEDLKKKLEEANAVPISRPGLIIDNDKDAVIDGATAYYRKIVDFTRAQQGILD